MHYHNTATALVVYLRYNRTDARYITRYGSEMILSIRHKGLKRLYADDDPSGVIAEHAAKLRDILTRLDAAQEPEDMDMPGFRLHALKGDMKGFWAVTVRANWRVIFRFAAADAFDVDYLDYH
jgi:proteic killer suppression protein